METKGENYFSYVTRLRGSDDREAVEVSSSAEDQSIDQVLELVNGIAETLSDLRRRADAGDVKAMYDANLQIELLKNARRKIEASGRKLRFDSANRKYAFV